MLMAAEPTISDETDSRNREEAEPKKKLKKRSSTTVARVLPSRRSKSRHSWPPADLSDSSPNYVTPIDSFCAKEEDSKGVKCRYNHCSLNGHCHHMQTPEKRFPYLRRKPVKPLMSEEARIESKAGRKPSSERKKGSDEKTSSSMIEHSVRKGSHVENNKSRGKGISTEAGMSQFRGARRNILGPNLTEVARKRSNYPEKGERESLNQIKSSWAEENISGRTSEIKETSCGKYSMKFDEGESISIAFGEPALEVQQPKITQRKDISMWHLIHKYVASELVANDAGKPLQGVDTVKQMEKIDACTAKECSDVSSHSSSSRTGIDNHEIVDEETEIRKHFAVKLVRKAIEKILLPELDAVEDQDLSENNPQEGSSGSNNNDHVENTPADQIVLAHNDETISEGEKKSEIKSEKRSDKKSPNNWSNLKKLILLQRFIRELEKVKEINFEKSQQKQFENGPEADKFYLRHQNVDERKRSEKWMLDYAIRQEVSQLAPTQKRKVAILVKAFETVVPPQEDFNFQITIPKLKNKLDKDAYITSKEVLSALKMKGDKSQTEKNIAGERSSVSEEHSEINSFQRPVVDGIQSSNTVTNSCEDVSSVNDESQREICNQIISSLNTEYHFSDHFPYRSENTTFEVGVKSTENQEIVSPGDENAEDNARRKSNQEQTTPQEKQRNADLRLISEQSGIEETNEPLNTFPSVMLDKIAETMQLAAASTSIPQDSTGKETIREHQPVPPMDLNSQYTEKEASQLLEAEDGDSKYANKSSETECNDDRGKENHESAHKQGESSRSEVVILVQESVDEILLPEVVDDSCDITEKDEQGDVWDQSIASSSRSGFLLDKEEKGSKHDTDSTEDSEQEKYWILILHGMMHA